MIATPTKRHFTPDDLLRLPDEGASYELVDGELRERTKSTESSRIGLRIGRFFSVFCDSAGGWVFGSDMGLRCFADPDKVRRADAAIVSLERMPIETYEDTGYCTVVPDLVAEVISPHDNAYEVEAKIAEWLRAGVKVVWEVYPSTQTVHAHSSDSSARTFRLHDTLTAPEVLPGFSVPVADLFRLPGKA